MYCIVSNRHLGVHVFHVVLDLMLKNDAQGWHRNLMRWAVTPPRLWYTKANNHLLRTTKSKDAFFLDTFVPHQYSGILHVSSQFSIPSHPAFGCDLLFFYPDIRQNLWRLDGTWCLYKTCNNMRLYGIYFSGKLLFMYVCTCMWWPKEFYGIFFCLHIVFTLTILYQFSLLCDENFIFSLSKPDLFGWPGMQHTLKKEFSQTTTQIQAPTHHEVNLVTAQ